LIDFSDPHVSLLGTILARFECAGELSRFLLSLSLSRRKPHFVRQIPYLRLGTKTPDFPNLGDIDRDRFVHSDRAGTVGILTLIPTNRIALPSILEQRRRARSNSLRCKSLETLA